MLPDRVSNPGPLTYESGAHALPIALRGPADFKYEWTVCNFTSYSTVFQSIQDIGREIMKGFVQWSPVWKDCCIQRKSGPGPLDQQANA